MKRVTLALFVGFVLVIVCAASLLANLPGSSLSRRTDPDNRQVSARRRAAGHAARLDPVLETPTATSTVILHRPPTADRLFRPGSRGLDWSLAREEGPHQAVLMELEEHLRTVFDTMVESRQSGAPISIHDSMHVLDEIGQRTGSALPYLEMAGYLTMEGVQERDTAEATHILQDLVAQAGELTAFEKAMLARSITNLDVRGDRFAAAEVASQLASGERPGVQSWSIDYWLYLAQHGQNPEIRAEAWSQVGRVPCESSDCPLRPEVQSHWSRGAARCVVLHDMQAGQYEVPGTPGPAGTCLEAALSGRHNVVVLDWSD